jgi:nucleoid-associated protein EbfC
MNPMDMFKNLQNMQSKVGVMQEKLRELTVTGTSGGDMVRIVVNGQMEVQKVHISPEAVDTEDIEMLEDLIFAAFSDASVKVKEKLKDEMSALTGGIDIPPEMLGL